MAATPPLEQAIADALEQVRAELIRLFLDGDVGIVEVHVGKEQMRVKSRPERTHDAVRLK